MDALLKLAESGHQGGRPPGQGAHTAGKKMNHGMGSELIKGKTDWHPGGRATLCPLNPPRCYRGADT